MSGEDIEIRIEVLDVDAAVRNSLSAVNKHGDSAAVRYLDHGFDRVDGPQSVGDMDHTDQTGAIIQKLFVLLQDQLAAVVDRDDAQPRTGLFAQHLPGNDVGVMFDPADQDLVTLRDV